MARRQQEADETTEVARAAMELEAQKQQAAVAASFAKQSEAEAAHRDFLPYGAKPHKYFETSKMAAWGIYQSEVDEASDQYSAETRALLKHDMATKIPYRYQTTPPQQQGQQPLWPLHGTAGVVLDIDGVVVRGGRIIDGSDEAIRQMVALKIPFVFMTNGGGITEAARAAQLSALLQCEIFEDQVIMSHSPMSLLAERYANETVLIGGGPTCVDVAKHYGFHRAKSMLQFQAEHPELVPLRRWHKDETTPAAPFSVPYEPIAAIFQFADAYDAFSDTQVMLDVMTSPYGFIGGGAVSRTQTTPLYYGADDLIYAAQATLPRLGGGAFREMFTAVFESVTGTNLHVTPFGKPRAVAYAFAERKLRAVSTRLGWNPDSMRMVAMIGDNLETDILGANARGAPWLSVHVMSGVGNAPAATRTMSHDDAEMEWMSASIERVPHYVAPTFDHFFRELLAFPEDVMTQHRKPYFGPPCPVDLGDTYNFRN